MTTATAERELLAWLTLAFRAPRPDRAELLCRADLAGLTEAAGLPVLEADFPEPAALAENLEAPYVRLFVTSRETEVAHPEALAYLVNEGAEAQATFLRAVLDEIRSAGYRLAPESDRPADHLTVLLELLYSLSGDSPEALRDHRFTRRYLAAWIPAFLGRLEAAKPPPFYRTAGRLLENLIT